MDIYTYIYEKYKKKNKLSVDLSLHSSATQGNINLMFFIPTETDNQLIISFFTRGIGPMIKRILIGEQFSLGIVFCLWWGLFLGVKANFNVLAFPRFVFKGLATLFDRMQGNVRLYRLVLSHLARSLEYEEILKSFCLIFATLEILRF